MAIVNRTSDPISPKDLQLYLNIKRQLRNRRKAYLGDKNGVTRVSNNPDVQGDRSGFGKYYARYLVGVDDNHEPKYGERFKVKMGAVSFPNRAGLPVYIEDDPSTTLPVIVGYDDEVVIASGIDTRQFNQGDANNYQLGFRMLQNLKTKTHTQTTGDELTLTVQDLIYIWNDTVQNAVKGLSNGIDMTSYVSSDTTKEVFLALGLNPYDNSIEVVSSGEQAIDTNSITMAELTTLITQFPDYVIPDEVYRVPGGVTALQPSHRELGVDLRQLVNIPQPRGVLTNITRHVLYLNGYHENVVGGVEISGSGGLEIETGGSYVIL